MDLVVRERQEKINQLKTFLARVDEQILSVTKQLNWDYEKLVQEESTNMVTCSINPQHKVPITNIQTHEEKCAWRQQGYHEDDKPFSEFFGSGSFISLNPSLLKSITEEFISDTEKAVRFVPQTSANLDQNFSREEKLAIYDYVIANTKKQQSFSNLSLELPEKNEKKEMTEWEIAAAERDAKRRRASYRNKVHTNRKTHTEILKEVIEIQMEALKEEAISNTPPCEADDYKRPSKKHKKDKHSDRESPGRRDRKDKHDKRNRDRHSKHKDRSHKRSPPASGSNSDSRSRSRDKYRKYESYTGRSHSHKSSKYHDMRQG